MVELQICITIPESLHIAVVAIIITTVAVFWTVVAATICFTTHTVSSTVINTPLIVKVQIADYKAEDATTVIFRAAVPVYMEFVAMRIYNNSTNSEPTGVIKVQISNNNNNNYKYYNYSNNNNRHNNNNNSDIE